MRHSTHGLLDAVRAATGRGIRLDDHILEVAASPRFADPGLTDWGLRPPLGPDRTCPEPRDRRPWTHSTDPPSDGLTVGLFSLPSEHSSSNPRASRLNHQGGQPPP